MKENILIVGTFSTWSIRAWMCLKLANVTFSEQVVILENSDFKAILNKHSPTGLVPVFIDEYCKLHDSLAIAEYANELSAGIIYPDAINERALARSYCAELHSGFMHLRNVCPFHFSQQPAVTITPELRQELDRLIEIWFSAQGNFMFEKPSVVDVFYAVLAYRLFIYGIELPEKAGQYQQSLLEWPLFQSAITQAKSWSHEISA